MLVADMDSATRDPFLVEFGIQSPTTYGNSTTVTVVFIEEIPLSFIGV